MGGGGKDVICLPDSFSSGLDRETVTKEMDMRMPSAVICRREGHIDRPDIHREDGAPNERQEADQEAMWGAGGEGERGR